MFTKKYRSPALKPSPLSFASLALLIFAGWQAFSTLSRMPAFNPSLQVENSMGRHYLGYAPAMFDRAEYYRWMAVGWLGPITEAKTSGDAAGMSEALRRLRDNAIESLRHSPGDPTSWMYLAEAEAGLGQPSSALDALERAHELTPHSLSRAVGRVAFLAGFMEDPEARALALIKLDLDIVDADLGLLAGDRLHAPIARLIRDSLVAGGLALSPLPEA